MNDLHQLDFPMISVIHRDPAYANLKASEIFSGASLFLGLVHMDISPDIPNLTYLWVVQKDGNQVWGLASAPAIPGKCQLVSIVASVEMHGDDGSVGAQIREAFAAYPNELAVKAQAMQTWADQHSPDKAPPYLGILQAFVAGTRGVYDQQPDSMGMLRIPPVLSLVVRLGELVGEWGWKWHDRIRHASDPQEVTTSVVAQQGIFIHKIAFAVADQQPQPVGPEAEPVVPAEFADVLRDILGRAGF